MSVVVQDHGPPFDGEEDFEGGEVLRELNTILSIICKLTTARCGWISLLRPDGTFEPAAVFDLPGELERDHWGALRRGTCRCQRMLLDGELSSAANVLLCERLEETGLSRKGLAYHASVPLRWEGRSLGVMNLVLPEERTFSQKELDLLSLVGQTVSAVLEQRRRYYQAKARQAETEWQLGVMMKEFPGLVAICDPGGRALFVNDVGRQMLGMDPQRAGNSGNLFEYIPELRRVADRARGENESGRIRAWKSEAVLYCKDGHQKQVLLTVLFPPKTGRGEEWALVIGYDISERKRFEEQLRRLADFDSLTGVFNRRRFQEELAASLERHERGALLFIDFDNFKAINDNLGHRAGDELLTRLVRSMSDRIGSQGFVGRLGGDEFAIYLPGVDVERAKRIAEGLSKTFRRHRVFLDGKRVIITASIGIAEYPARGQTAEQLLAHADTAMYTAKRTGANVHVYDPFQGEEAATTEELVWATRIREALEKDLFVLYAQPIMDLQSERVSRFELLLRMKGDGGRLISPKAFLGVAEKSDLIHHIDVWVTRQAIRLLAESRRERPDVCFHVNLSAKVFGNRQFASILADELALAKTEPHQLLFEITETAAITDYGRAREFITVLREMGFHFALDDFGIGFSSFYSLKYLPLDYLKIDGVFIQDLAVDAVDQCLVKGLAMSMKELGIQTIAEFVEDAETLRILRSYGVDYAQGFHVGPPVPVFQVLRKSG